MKWILSSLMILSLTASAKTDSEAVKKKLVDHMVTACKNELSKDPALAEIKDGEAVWRNLEDKEEVAKMKLSKGCHAAHEKYEDKYHRGEEHDEK